MASMRVQRVSELIRETLGDLMRKIKDPRIGFVTITEVDVSPDLEIARIFVSILGTQEERENTMQGLESASGYLRKELGHLIRLRKTPKLVFEFDPGIERGAKILKIIEEVTAKNSDISENDEE
jgi:ribosome-binding factor A